MKYTEIKIVMNSGQVIKSSVKKENMADYLNKREVDFNENLILEPEDISKDSCYIINSKFVESITLTEKDL